MENLLNQIVSLRGEDSLILWEFIEQINDQLEKGANPPDQLVSALKDWNIFSAKFVDYNSEKVSAVKQILIALLMDNQSVKILTENILDYDARYLAITFLGWFGDSARSSIPELLGVIGSAHPANGAAKRTIQMIGGAEQLVLSAIKDSITFEDDSRFIELCDLALHTSLRHSTKFFELLALGAKSENSDLRWADAEVIGNLSTSQKRAMMTVLDDLINDPIEDVRKAARQAFQGDSNSL